MGEWKEVSIKSISSRITSGGTPSTKCPEYYGGNIPWLNTKEVNFRVIESTDNYITELGLRNSSAKWIEANSIIVAMYGATAGKCALTKIPLTTNQACCNITIDKTIADFRFIYYSLVDSYSELENMATGAAQQNLNAGMIAEFSLLLPPLPEQKAIAAVLSSLDDKIDLLHRQNKTLEAMAETLFRQWFVEEADEGWEEVPLSFFADNIRENVKVENLSDHEHYVGLEHIPRKRVSLDSWGSTDSIESNKSTFKKYDILFGKLRSYFHKVVCTPIGGVCSTDILVIRPKKEHWLPFCLFWFFSKDVVEHSDLGSGGTRMPRTNWEIVSSYKVPCPPEELIIDYDKILRPSLNKMFQNINAIRTLEKLRNILLPKLMSGEIRVETGMEVESE